MRATTAGIARLGTLVALAAVLALAGAAWACTVAPRIVALSAVAGPSGSAVTVNGQGASPDADVALRWSDLHGQLLAQTRSDSSGAFSVVATVPEVAPGVYTVLAVVGDKGVARSAFEVTGGPAAVTTGMPSAPLVQPALLDVGASQPASSPSGVPLRLGMAMLSFGLFALAAAGGLAVARRPRRAPAGPDA